MRFSAGQTVSDFVLQHFRTRVISLTFGSVAYRTPSSSMAECLLSSSCKSHESGPPAFVSVPLQRILATRRHYVQSVPSNLYAPCHVYTCVVYICVSEIPSQQVAECLLRARVALPNLAFDSGRAISALVTEAGTQFGRAFRAAALATGRWNFT